MTPKIKYRVAVLVVDKDGRWYAHVPMQEHGGGISLAEISGDGTVQSACQLMQQVVEGKLDLILETVRRKEDDDNETKT